MSEIRLKIIYVLFCFYFFILVSRLFYLQIIKNTDYRREIGLQTEGKIPIIATRGEIFARDGYPMVLNKNAYVLNFDKNLNVLKKKLSDEQLAAVTKKLINDQQVFTVTNDRKKNKEREEKVKKYLTAIFSNDKIRAGVIYKKLTEKTKNEIEELKIPGLFATSENLRSYPESSMSAHILGFLGRDEQDNLKGFFGLEGYYDLELKGLNGYKKYEKDPLGNPILLDSYDKKEAINGRDLITSLDRGAQKIIEKWLQWGKRKYQAKAGSVILYDPYTGEVLAMANEPSFDPNIYYFFSDADKRNVAISDEYEPGSIMKPLVMAMALNENLVNTNSTCPRCAGPRELSGYLIRTFDDQYLPNLTMMQILQRSDNTGMTYVGELLGRDRLLTYFNQLGFGQKTGIDLEGEVSGYIKPKKDIYAIDQATMTFGQGISVTSIQMVKAFGALITGATVKPKVVSYLADNLRKDKIESIFNENVYSKNTISQITDILINVTEKSPLHFARDNIPGLKLYKIAAKSGTAQIPLSGKYAENKTVGTVIGYAPAFQPRFILFVKLDEAQANIWGANTAGPIFFNILNDLLIYYDVAPE